MFAKSSKTFLLLLVLYLTIGAIKGDDDDDECTTPDSRKGRCVEVNECEKIEGLILKMREGLIRGEKFDRAKIILKKFICSKNGETYKFCCTPPRPALPKPFGFPSRFLLPEDCGTFDEASRVANGVEAGLMEFPWMALLEYKNGTHKFACGGTLINDRYVLTAAHCINSNLTSVRLGENYLNTTRDCYTPSTPIFMPKADEICATPVQDIGIEKTIIHPNYNLTLLTSDIALIRLRSKADISSDSVRPICLPLTEPLQSKNLTDLIITGWGITDKIRSKPSDILMKVNAPVKPLDVCRNIYSNQINVTEKHFCIGGDEANGSCTGDSGGPLQFIAEVDSTLKYVQFGVISAGPSSCGRTDPGVHVKLSHYIDWVLKTIEP